MPELPKFAIERLKVSAALGVHPDADVLTAFAERSLPASERAVVLEHLARCGDCRDVLALAAPATETIEFERASSGLRSRWGWSVLRGLTVTAGVIAVAAVGIHQYRQRTPANTIVARNGERAVAASPVPIASSPTAHEAETLTPSAAPPREAVPRQSEGSAGKVSSNKPLTSDTNAFGWRAKSTGAAGSAGGGIGAGAGLAPGTKMAMAERPRDLDFAAPQAPSANTTKQVPAPYPARLAPSAASNAVEVQDEVVTAEARAPAQSLRAQSTDTASVEGADNVTRAKPAPEAAGAAIGGPVVVARNQNDLRANEQVVTPHWTISSTGSLQRSVDGGKTWQDVNVNIGAGFYTSARPMAAESNDLESKQVAKKLTKGKTSKAEPAPVFRSVAAIGNDVWAGASGGLLYHSADAGALWTSIIPSAQGVMLSGDIVRIEFPDALHGRITTSTSESWVTADGGQSWQKQ